MTAGADLAFHPCTACAGCLCGDDCEDFCDRDCECPDHVRDLS